MKKTLALLLLSAAMVFTLAACGSDPDMTSDIPGSTVNPSVNDPMKNDGSVTDGALPNNGNNGSTYDSTYDNTQNNGTNGAVTPNDGLASNDAMDGATAQSHTNKGEVFKGASYEQMVRNGKVHDNDGNLNDGENATTPGIRVF